MLESPLSLTWNSSYRGIHTDYPDQIFSGSIAEVVDYLTRVKEKGVRQHIYFCLG
jgi:hypothetical protein